MFCIVCKTEVKEGEECFVQEVLVTDENEKVYKSDGVMHGPLCEKCADRGIDSDFSIFPE